MPVPFRTVPTIRSLAAAFALLAACGPDADASRSAAGAINWEGGSYGERGWDGTYEHVARPEGDGRPDEDVIRIASESDGLKIDCFKTVEG